MNEKEKPKPITTSYKLLGDYAYGALQRIADWGVTDRFSTGISELDNHLGGGFGRKRGYEIILLFGDTGIGKSTLAMNIISPAMLKGDRVGLMILEDDPEDVSIRLSNILPKQSWSKLNKADNVFVLPDEALERAPWSLPMLQEQIRHWFVDLKIDLIVLDHIQFAFEGADAPTREGEWYAQRTFMRNLRVLMKQINRDLGQNSSKTFMYVSHINKTSSAKGMDRVLGSSGLVQSATKVISIDKGDTDGLIDIQLLKSRFTKLPINKITLKTEGVKLIFPGSKPKFIGDMQ